jgi:hypothetical protein
MGNKEKTCKDCKFFMVAPANPFKGTCTVNRKNLSDSQASKTFIPGKLVKGENPACDKFEESAGWEDSVEQTL